MDVDFGSMTSGERLEAFAKLTQMLCGVGVPLSEADGQWVVPFTATVPPKQTICVCVRPHVLFKPRRLIIFEPETTVVGERVVTPESTREIESRKWWFGKTTRTIERVPEVRERFSTRLVVHRAAWAIHALFVGNRVQLSTEARISGDAFDGTNASMDFDGILCDPGLDISLQIENTRSIEAPLRGVIVGEVPKATLKKSAA